MATISAPTLAIANVNNTTVSLTVHYTLTPSQIEKLAGTVFSENIRLTGDDPGTVGDITILNFPADAFAVNSSTASVTRKRVRNILKSALNEDPTFMPTGAEIIDEVFARVTLSYAANAPNPPTLPAPASTALVAGAWK